MTTPSKRIMASGLSDSQVADLARAFTTARPAAEGEQVEVELVARDEIAARIGAAGALAIALAADDASAAAVEELRASGVRQPVLLLAVLDTVAAPELGAVVTLAPSALEQPSGSVAATTLARFSVLVDLVQEIERLRLQLREVEEARFQQRLEIEHLSRHLEALDSDDELTGLRSERAMARSIGEAFNLARRHQTPVACLIVEVDEFGQLADRFGDAFAEFVLEQIAHRLKSCMRQTDLLSRYAKGAFLMLSPFTAEDGSKGMAERLREAVSGQHLEHEGEKLKLGLNVGLANWRLQMTSSSELVQAAVGAAEHAREGGGGVHVV